MALFPASQSVLARVVFDGFESDTYRLQRAGWDIAVDERIGDPMDDVSRMLLKHRGSGVTILAICRNFRQEFYRTRSGEHRYSQDRHMPEYMAVNVKSGSEKMIVRGSGRGNEGYSWVDNLRMIDAAPNFVMVEEYDLMRLPLFARAAEPRAEELIVEPATVLQLLEQIRQQQAPEQAEIRKRQRSAGNTPTIHATILSLAA